MAPVVELKVQDLAQAVQYYEALLAVNPQKQANGSAMLVGDHLQLKLSATTGQSGPVTLNVTSGMFARILDAAMQARCQINMQSPERAEITDKYGQSWTLTR